MGWSRKEGNKHLNNMTVLWVEKVNKKMKAENETNTAKRT